MADPIEIPFGMLSLTDPRNHMLDGVSNPLWEGAVLRGGAFRDIISDDTLS